MMGFVSRPIAVAALVAFLVANCYGISHSTLPFSGCTCANHQPNHEPEASESCDSLPDCHSEHCHAYHDQGQSEPMVMPSGEHYAESASPVSPYQGISHPCPCCPCQGGCAFCSVAKVPCLLPAELSMNTTPARGDGVSEVIQSYTSPFHGTLTRPPRV
jgi:hypothetical protein